MRENTAYLYGQLTRDPICYKNPSTQELLSGQITIKTARRTNATGELFVKGRLRIDFITIYSRNEKLIREQFMSLRQGDKETEWRATPNVTIMDADKTDSDLNENHKENIEQMSSDKISMAVDAEESMNNHLKEDNTEKEEIENLSPLKEDNVINNKQLNEKNDSISMEKNDKTQETMIDTNGSNNIEKIMEDTFHGETTVSSDKDHIIDNTPVQEDIRRQRGYLVLSNTCRKPQPTSVARRCIT